MATSSGLQRPVHAAHAEIRDDPSASRRSRCEVTERSALEGRAQENAFGFTGFGFVGAGFGFTAGGSGFGVGAGVILGAGAGAGVIDFGGGTYVFGAVGGNTGCGFAGGATGFVAHGTAGGLAAGGATTCAWITCSCGMPATEGSGPANGFAPAYAGGADTQRVVAANACGASGARTIANAGVGWKKWFECTNTNGAGAGSYQTA